jgi:hypothetical protein
MARSIISKALNRFCGAASNRRHENTLDTYSGSLTNIVNVIPVKKEMLTVVVLVVHLAQKSRREYVEIYR